MREINIVSEDKPVETKKYPKNLLQEIDEVDKDGSTIKFGKNVEDGKQFPSQIPKTNEIPIKGGVSPLKSETQDLKNKDTTKNIQDEQIGVEKSKTFPGQKSITETSNKMLTDKEPETFPLSGRDDGKPEKFEKKKISDVSPEKSQNLKDEPKRLDETQRAQESKLSPKFTREQLAGENKNVDNPLERKPSSVVDKISVFNAPTDGEKIDSEKQQGMGLIEDEASAKTIPKLSSSQKITKKSTTEGEKLKPQDKTLPGSVEQGNLNKVKKEVGDRLPTQDELIASKGSQSDINQEYEKATKPQKESKISERIKSIESLLPPSHPSKPSKVPAKSTDKLTQDQSDDRLKDKLSASGKDGKLTKKDSKDFDRLEVKQSKDNLRSKRSPDEMKTGQERNKQLDGIQPKKEEGRDSKLEQSKAKSKSIDKERRKIKSSDSEGSLSQSSQSQGGGMRHDDGIQDRKGSRNLRETGKLDKLTSSRVSKEKKHADKLPTHLTKKEQEKAGKPSEKPDEYSASRNIQSKNQVPADKAVRKSAPQTNAKGDQTLLRKSKIDEKQLQGKVIRGDNKSKEKEEPDYSKAEASQIREKDKAMGQSKIKTQVKKDEKVDPKLRKSASQKVDPKEIAASRKINGTGKKGTVPVDSQDVKHSRSLPPQYTSDSETNNAEKPDTWKIKPTLLEKMKKYGIQVLTLDELDRLHDEVLVAMRAHHGLTDSETDETDIQKELQQLSPEDLGNLHSELSDLAENKKSRNKPLQSMSKIKILTQLAGGRSPPEHDTSGSTAPKRKPAEIPTDITKRVLRPDTLKIGSPTDDATSRMMEPNRLGIGVPSSSLASQKRLGAPPGKDQLSPTYRPQNMNEPRSNDPRMEVAESLRRRNDDFVQGRRPSKVQDRRTSQMRGSIIEKLQQYINDQTLAGKPLKKKPSHECHCTPQDKNIVKKCFCSH
ncbi:nucleolar protein dao-5 isoform X2 [Nilaparvata lugens]|uniref:nucleolar protein dao-5 isoform X2 n=1 Tax=Nilaparvata lugens TaxID=108931 RepID=UPI00193D050C|nr:nucleolar protein dao-5 isoform X2 [Nilaparvata lugens]